MNQKKIINNYLEQEIQEGLFQAHSSSRSRYVKILHNQGAELNQAFNFMLRNSYMQPHLHPGDEKVEEIFLVRGKLAVLFFDDYGNIQRVCRLNKEGVDSIKIPAFTWHTYVMLSDNNVTYETMSGRYDPMTWKRFAAWAPMENSFGCFDYLNFLKISAGSSD